jgi:hypothetical protein
MRNWGMKLIKPKYGIMIIAILLFFASISSNSVFAATTKDIMFGKVKVQTGMIGKIDVLKQTTIQKKDNKGKVTIVQTVKKGEQYGVYSKGSGLYQLGEGQFIKHTTSIKYSALPKSILEKLKEKEETLSAPIIDVTSLNEVEKEYYNFANQLAKDYGFAIRDVGYYDSPNGGKLGTITFIRPTDKNFFTYWVKGNMEKTEHLNGTKIQTDYYFVSTKRLTNEKDIDGLVSLATFKTKEINKDLMKEQIIKLFKDDSYSTKYEDSGWRVNIYINAKANTYEMTIEPAGWW